MPASHVIAFGENTRTMTYEEGLAFVARTRRQLDRFSVALPLGDGQAMTPEDAVAIRRKLDDLESDFRKDLGII
jgi:hypothetical protein